MSGLDVLAGFSTQILPTEFGKFVVTNLDRDRVWDGDHWRAFGGGELFNCYADAMRAARIARATPLSRVTGAQP